MNVQVWHGWVVGFVRTWSIKKNSLALGCQLSSHKLGALLPVGAVDPDDLVPVPLREVHKAAVHEDCHNDQDKQEAQLFVSLKVTWWLGLEARTHLLQSDDEGLQASKVSHQFKDPQDTHYPHKTDYFSSFPDNFKLLETLLNIKILRLNLWVLNSVPNKRDT